LFEVLKPPCPGASSDRFLPLLPRSEADWVFPARIEELQCYAIVSALAPPSWAFCRVPRQSFIHPQMIHFKCPNASVRFSTIRHPILPCNPTRLLPARWTAACLQIGVHLCRPDGPSSPPSVRVRCPPKSTHFARSRPDLGFCRK